MPKINAQLIERLKARLGVGTPRVYAIIAEKASQTLLDRHLAALVVATESGVNIHKFSTSEERGQIRGTLKPSGSDAQQSSTSGVSAKPAKLAVRAKKDPPTAKAKDNSVFVVHGRNDKLR